MRCRTAINPDTGRVHTSYSIAGANTGRLASTDPNLQNIPSAPRKAAASARPSSPPRAGCCVSLDYSQIELRILAHIADIPALKQAFDDGIDIHALTASEMFNVPLDQMTRDIRRKAKAINFGVIYGISGFGLARNLRIPRAEAQGFIDRYFERFPGIKDYMSDTVKFAQANGYVQTLFGRKINTPEINAKGPGAGFAKRAAINAPIQGTAADVIRRAMIRMPRPSPACDARCCCRSMTNLLFEVAEDEADRLIPVAKEVMEGAAHPAVHLNVHLAVEAGKGRTGQRRIDVPITDWPDLKALALVAEPAEGHRRLSLGPRMPEGAWQDVVLVVALRRCRRLQGRQGRTRDAAGRPTPTPSSCTPTTPRTT